MKRALITSVIVAILLGAFSLIYIIKDANKLDYLVVSQKINPDSRFYFGLKRVLEKIELSYIDNFDKEKRSEFLASLANRRLSELQYIVSTNPSEYIEKSSSRYLTTMGLLKDSINSPDKARKVEKMLEQHPAILTKTRDKFPFGSGRLFIQQCLDTANSLLSTINKIQ